VDWQEARAKDYYLTTLVTDIRGSSRGFNHAPIWRVNNFLHAFASLTDSALRNVCPTEDYSINNFFGDGFLVFFSEPDPHAGDKVGPGRAVAAAVEMRMAFRSLIRCGDQALTGPEFQDMALVAGGGYGQVLYGLVTGTVLPYPLFTGITTEVTLAFRLAELADPEQIIVSENLFRNLGPPSIPTRPLTVRPRGFSSVICHEVLHTT
jgi:class 3 adenylate cyclase